MMNGGKRKIELIEYVGLFLVAFSFLMLVVNPGGIGNLFNNMFNHAAPIIIKVYITGSIGIAIIISVTMGRLLERLGFTDALMRIFVPLMKVIGVNAAVAVPSVYNILGDINEVANSIVPPGLPSHRKDAPAYKFNPAEAKKLLAAAGYPNGQGLPTLVLSHRDGQPDVRTVAEAVVTQLRQNLGVQAKTQMLPWNAYLDRNNRKQLDFFHMRWGADYPDPENFLSTLLASYGNENKTNYKNPEYDALCMQADTMVNNDEERWRLYNKAEDIVLKNGPFVPIYYQRDAELISPRVKNMRESVFGHLPHTTTSLE